MSKGLEVLKEIKNNPKLDLNDVYIRFEIIEKELKALEIISECLIVMANKDYIEITCEFSIPKKNNEKYELLKEVLL